MSKNELRKFGLILGTVLAGWGAWWLKKEADLSIYFLITSLLLLLPALFYPLGLKPVFVVWTKLGLALSRITTRVILALIFYLILTPIGLLLRITGKDLLKLKNKTKTKSYWQTPSGIIDKKRLLKQY
jgi:hypothetical protein